MIVVAVVVIVVVVVDPRNQPLKIGVNLKAIGLLIYWFLHIVNSQKKLAQAPPHKISCVKTSSFDIDIYLNSK